MRTMPAIGLARPGRPQPRRAPTRSLGHVGTPRSKPKPQESKGPVWSSPHSIFLKFPPLGRSSCPRTYGWPKTRKKKSVSTTITSVHKTPMKPVLTLDLGATGNQGVAHGNAQRKLCRHAAHVASSRPGLCSVSGACPAASKRSRHITDWR